MALVVNTPGVYIEEVSKFPPSVAQVETAIPAFIGFTEIAKNSIDEDLRNVPTRIVSLLEYERYFGLAQKETWIEVLLNEDRDANGNQRSLSATASFAGNKQSRHNMYYAMQMYFGNGGGPCYIISIGGYTAIGTQGWDKITAAAATATTPAVLAEDKVTQVEMGVAFSEAAFLAGLDILASVDEPTLIVFPEGQEIVAADKYYALIAAALKQCDQLKDRFAIIDLYDDGRVSTTNQNVQAFRDATTLGSINLKYGAAYYPDLVTTLNYNVADGDVKVKHQVTTNGAAPSDGYFNNRHLNFSLLVNTIYYAKCVDAISKLKLIMSPSSSVAGIYATVDASRGVWKAPANVSLSYVRDLTDLITDEENGVMNIDATAGKSVNAIRAFTGKGILVWGARTLAGNDNEWRYVPVRRLFIMVEESIKKATMQFVFEPNDAVTWTKVRAMISNYLTSLWSQGALAGAKPDQAFYVNCGLNVTMSAQDILEGKMNIEIGMAAVRPAEFIILRFSHKMQE